MITNTNINSKYLHFISIFIFPLISPDSAVWALAGSVLLWVGERDHHCPSHICVPSACLITAHTYRSIASCDCVKSLGLYFPRHRDKERKSECSYLWQYQGKRAQWCLGDSVVIGTKQIKCQPFKRWLGSRGSGQANSFGKQSAAISFLFLCSCLDFLDTDRHFEEL